MRSLGFIFISFLTHSAIVLVIFFMLQQNQTLDQEPKPQTKINFVEIPSEYLGDNAVNGEKKIKKETTKQKPSRQISPNKSESKKASLDSIISSPLENIPIPKSKEITIPGLMGRQLTTKDLIPPSVSQLPPGVDIGELMPLDIDNDIYYNFNRRVRERVVPGWIRRVYAEIWRMWNSGELGSSEKKWRTVLVVKLNKKGELIDTNFRLMSDSFTIDSALAESFQEAKIFPNPPEGLLDENSEVIMTWQINVRYLPSPRFR